jgi:hypothetical protein
MAEVGLATATGSINLFQAEPRGKIGKFLYQAIDKYFFVVNFKIIVD